MAANSLFVILFASCSFTVTSNQDAEVSCVYLESCVLPCDFEPGPDPIINWWKTLGDILIYSVYNDKLQHQDEEYKLRSSVSVEELTTGNASLLLKHVKVQDEGKYVCSANTGHSSKTIFVSLKVYVNKIDANVKAGSELIVTSEGIYPKPEVMWYFVPPYAATEGKTVFFSRDDQLFDVYSSVSRPSQDKAYICTVRTDHTFRTVAFINAGKILRVHEAIVTCSAPRNAQIMSLIWKFNNHIVIYNRTGPEQVYNESWRPFVDGITDSNSLVLYNMSSNHEGLYSCHITTSDSATFIISTKVEILWLPVVYILFAWVMLAFCVKNRK